MRRVALPNEALYPIRTLAAAGAIYGVASVAHGSGFLAVFVAGLLVGGRRAPYKGEIERFHTSLANLAEIVVFVALGLTIDLGGLDTRLVWLDGILLALILAFVARPLACGLLLIPARLHMGERLFVLWGGLKGAVPILLAAFAVIAGAGHAERIYGIVFVVVLFSVVVQGSSIPFVAPRLGVPMRIADPHGLTKLVVQPGSRTAATRSGSCRSPGGRGSRRSSGDERAVRPRGSTVAREGDVVRLSPIIGDVDTLRRLFGRRSATARGRLGDLAGVPGRPDRGPPLGRLVEPHPADLLGLDLAQAADDLLAAGTVRAPVTEGLPEQHVPRAERAGHGHRVRRRPDDTSTRAQALTPACGRAPKETWPSPPARRSSRARRGSARALPLGRDAASPPARSR